MKNRIENLSNTLLNEFGLFNQSLYHDLCDVNMVDFLIHNFIFYPESHVLRVLIVYNRVLKEVTFSHWLNVYSHICNSEIALLTYVRFLRQFLGIDSIAIMDGFKESNPELIESVKRYFEERGSLIIPNKWTMKLISSSHGNVQVFKDVHNKLIREGAPSSSAPFLWDL